MHHPKLKTVTKTHQYHSSYNSISAATKNKKFELMLTRCTKAYSSSCSQSPAISSQFICGVCAAAEDHKNQ